MIRETQIFEDPRWKAIEGQPLSEAPSDLLAQSLRIAIEGLADQAGVARWLMGNLLAARKQLAEGRPDAALATLDAGLAGPQAPGASA